MDKEEEEQGEDRGLDGQPSPPPSVAAPGVVGAVVVVAAAAAAVVVNLAPQWRRRQGGFLSHAAGVGDVRLLTFGRHRRSTSDSERKRNQDFNVCLTNTDCERTLL